MAAWDSVGPQRRLGSKVLPGFAARSDHPFDSSKGVDDMDCSKHYQTVPLHRAAWTDQPHRLVLIWVCGF